MSGGVHVYRKTVGATARGKLLLAACALPVLAFFPAAAPARAQAPPSFVAANAYNAQPGTVPIQVATGVFNNAGGLLDFAVLEQVPNASSYQVEIYHGESGGPFCTNCNGASPDPDLIPLGSGVTGNAIAVGQFMSSGPLDIAVATNSGIDFLENNGSGTFTLSSTSIPSANGFVSLAVGLFHGDGNYDIAAVTPSVSGSIGFTVFFGNGARTFPTQSSSYPLSSTYVRCSAMMQGNFQSQTNSADLALECNNPSFASVLVYLNSGSGAFTSNQTLSSGSAFGGIVPGVALGVLNSQAAIFIASPSNSFVSYQSNGLTGAANAFTSVSMIPVGLAPHGSIAVLDNPLTGAVDFDVNGAGISTFTSYTQSGTSVNGTWNSTAAMGPGGVFAAGFSPNLTQGAAYVMVDASVKDGEYTNFYPFLEERSINVFLVTLNADGTFASTNAAPLYSGTGANGYSFPPSFATGDFNGDGQTDLAVTGANDATGDATLTIYLANLDGSLPATTSTPASVVTVSNTDYSGADAVVAGKFRPPQSGLTLYDLAVFSSNQIFVLPSNGDGTFGAGVSYPLSGDPNYPGFRYNPSAGEPFAPVLIATDVNGDGLDDIVLTLPEDNCNGSGSPSQGAVYVLISNGDETFQSPVFIAPPVVNPVSVVAANFFGRAVLGRAVPDLVIADGGEFCSGNTAATKGTAVGILQNNISPGASSISSSDFTPAAILQQSSDLSMPDVTAVATADLNADGKPDLVVSDANGIQVLLNQGGGSFTATAQGILPLYAGDMVPGPLCNSSNDPPLPPYVGCVNYVSQVATGSFFAAGENDVAASVNGVAYIFQNQGAGKLSPPTQGFVSGPNSTMISAALTGSNGLNGLLVATSQGTAYLANGSGAAAPSVSLTPSTLPFGSENMGTTSAPLTVTLTNTGTANLILSTVTMGGTNAGDFAESTDSCTGATVTPKSTCTVGVTFTPSATGSRAGSLSFTDNASNSPQTLGLTGTGVCQPITVGPSTLAPGTAGTPYGPVTFTESGGVGATTFSESGALPTGVTFSAPVLSGTTTQSGSFPITVTATDSNSCSGNITDTLTINSSTITPAYVTDNETITVTDTPTVTAFNNVTPINVAAPVVEFSAGPTIGFNGQSGSQTLEVSSIGLTSLILDSATISGSSQFTITQIACLNFATSLSTTLSSGGACNFTISYTPSATPATDAATLVFTDNAALSNLTTTAAGANYTQSISLSGSGTDTTPPPPPSATVTIPTINETITVTDTPTFPDVADSEAITVNDAVTVRAYNAISISPSTVVSGVLNQPYTSLTFVGSGGSGGLTLSESGPVPTGMAFNGFGPSITLSGTPTTLGSGSWPFTITAADSAGDAVTQSYTLTIAGACPSINVAPTSLSNLTLGTAFSQPFTESGGVGIITWLETGTLPPGLTFVGGLLSGSPTQAGNFSFTIVATDENSCTGNVSFSSLSVAPAPASVIDNETITVTDTPTFPDVADSETITVSDQVSITVSQSQTITFGTAPTVVVGGSGMLSATASSGLPVTFSSTTPAICSVAGSTVTGLAVGPCIVAANQPGNANYSPAPQVTQTISISASTGLSPATLTFGDQLVGSTSATRTVTLTNAGTAAVTVGAITTTADFTHPSKTCTATLAAGSSCTISVAFAPKAAGVFTGTLTVGTNGTVALSGTGIVPSASIAPATYTFKNQQVDTTSAVETFTYTNTGVVSITVSSVTLTGPAATNYVIASDPCTGVTLAAGATCDVGVTFTPSVANNRVANLSVTDETGGAAKATASLSGLGVAPTASLTGNAAFGNQQVGVTSAAQTLTYQNTGLGAISVSSAALSGKAATDYVIATDTCTAATLAASATCSIGLTFTPSKVSSRAASLTVTDSAGGATAQHLSLSGTGVAPTISLGSGTYAYGAVTVATAATFTLTNSGTAPLVISTIALTTGTQFKVTGGTCTVGGSVNNGGSCTVIVTFTPSGATKFTDTLTVPGTGVGTGAPTYTASRAMTGH